MADNNGSPGINKLARVISSRAQQVAGKAPRDLDIDFGTVQNDYSLLTDTFPRPIPRKDYHVCRTAGGLAVEGGTHGGHVSGDGGHSHMLPQIKPGDRVLVCWVQSNAVVVDVIVKI